MSYQNRPEPVQYFLENKLEFSGDEARVQLLNRLLSYIKPVSGDIVPLQVDVGCCIGGVLDAFDAFMLEENAMLICIEPNPDNSKYLRQLIRQAKWAGRIRLYECALSDQIGIATLSTIVDSPKNRPGYSLASLRGDGEVIAKVEIRTFDDIIEELALAEISIRLVKIDTEGHELEVIRGMDANLERIQYLVFEASDCLDDRRGPGIDSPLKRIIEILERHNFAVYKMGTHRLIKISGDDWHEEYERVKFHSNCFALKNDDSVIEKICTEQGFYL